MLTVIPGRAPSREPGIQRSAQVAGFRVRPRKGAPRNDARYSARAVLRTRFARVWIRKIAKLGSSCSMN
jgi:hypothetical protein